MRKINIIIGMLIVVLMSSCAMSTTPRRTYRDSYETKSERYLRHSTYKFQYRASTYKH